METFPARPEHARDLGSNSSPYPLLSRNRGASPVMVRTFWRKSPNHQNNTPKTRNRNNYRPHRFNPHLELLESRLLLTTVTNENDSGPGSLRDAINQVNSGMTNIIDYSASVQLIQPLSPYPEIVNQVTINGGASPQVDIDGSLSGGADGLILSGGNSTVKGMIINGFSLGRGIVLTGNGGNTIVGNLIGTTADGLGPFGNGIGIAVLSGNNNIIGNSGNQNRNIISGNFFNGLTLNSDHNTVANDFIGTDVTGTRSIPNQLGISIFGGSNNTIGGTAAGARDLISGNQGNAVDITSFSTGNVVEGNYIGTAVNGIDALGNNGSGVSISVFSDNNLVGGSSLNLGNVIMGSTVAGVSISLSANNRVEGNYIGLDFL